MQPQTKCKRCGRSLTNPISVERGYGPVCWRKTRETNQQAEKIAQLEREIHQLQAQVRQLSMPQKGNGSSIPMPGELQTEAKPAVWVFGWDVNELETNPLFQKQKALCEAA